MSNLVGNSSLQSVDVLRNKALGHIVIRLVELVAVNPVLLVTNVKVKTNHIVQLEF